MADRPLNYLKIEICSALHHWKLLFRNCDILLPMNPGEKAQKKSTKTKPRQFIVNGGNQDKNIMPRIGYKIIAFFKAEKASNRWTHYKIWIEGVLFWLLFFLFFPCCIFNKPFVALLPHNHSYFRRKNRTAAFCSDRWVREFNWCIFICIGGWGEDLTRRCSKLI